MHLFDYPARGSVTLPGYSNRVSYAQFLLDASVHEIDKERSAGNDIVLMLPKNKPDYEIPVVELILK